VLGEFAGAQPLEMEDLPSVGGPNIEQKMVTGADFWQVGSIALPAARRPG